ncbi:DMT family transporter [Ruegeria sp. THAF33]|uniref:DMT family transporter n=1 Tax=Ruegeria sp. THAF33 TaxID=2587853 RepID=UPI001267FD59|nr:DMT family transporter [Ruegeria sp. THAF33]QFT72555.1 EamA-like transporter family protein [Ruegeria sp. THAF33]
MRDYDFPRLGISLRILSGLLMAGMFVSVKAVSAGVPLGQIVFFRSFFAIFPLVVFLWIRGEFPSGLATERPGAHFLRAGFGALALFGSFAAVARLNLAEAILISQLSPILMALGAAILLAERLTRWRIWGLALGFAGIVVLIWPELTTYSWERGRLMGYFLGFATAVLTALALIMVRSLNKTESPGAIAFYFVLASMIGGIATLPWGWVVPNGPILGFLILSGLFGGFGHIAMTLAFRYAEASRLAPFEYIALLWPILADVFIFRLSLATSFLLAAPLILAGAAIAAAEKGGESRGKHLS